MEKETINKSEKTWVFIVRTLGLIIGFLPFIPNALFYIGLREEKLPITFSDAIFIIVGFIFVWGSRNFGTWANSLGKTIIEKAKK